MYGYPDGHKFKPKIDTLLKAQSKSDMGSAKKESFIDNYDLDQSSELVEDTLQLVLKGDFT